MTRVKVYGERNTGTNYLIQLLGLNTHARVLRGTSVGRVRARTANTAVHNVYFRITFPFVLGWKHRVAPSPAVVRRLGHGRTVFLCLVKNPYAWVLSMQRRPYESGHKEMPLDRFIDVPWEPLPWENRRGRFENLIEMWNVKTRSYFDLVDAGRGRVVRYEDLLDDAGAVFGQLAGDFGLPLAGGPFRNVERGAKKADAGKSLDYYRDYYLEERWRERFDDASLERISGMLDRDLVRRLGYGVIAGA